MKRTRRGVLLGSAAVVLAVGTWAGIAVSRRPLVETTHPVRGPIVGTLSIIGRVAAPAEVHFAAREPTAVTQTPVDEGQHVEAGTLLVHMDDAEALAMVQQAEAALAQAKAATREVSTVASKTANATLREARAELAEAERVAKADEAMFAKGSTSASQLDRSRTNLTVARSRARSAELAAAATSKNGAQWQAAVAAESFAEAGLLAAQSRAARLSVLAPRSGVVTKRSVEVGDTVQPGAHLLTLVTDGPTELVIEPDEKNLASLAEGQSALASAEAFSGQRFDAVVRYIAPAVDPARGTIEVRLDVPAPPDYLRTDMTVSVDIVVERKDDALTVPVDAVVDLATDPAVLVLDGGRLERRPVHLGIRGRERVEIIDGVRADEEIVALVEPGLGDRVRVRRGVD